MLTVSCAVALATSVLTIGAVDAQDVGGSVAIVVHPDVDIDELSMDRLRRIFLAEQQYWPDNSRIVLLVRAPAAYERTVVLERIYRMTEDQFWRLTPAKFSALSRRHDNAGEILDFRMAYVIATIYNVNRKRGRRAFTPKDFMPSTQREKRRRKSPSELHDTWKGFMGNRMKKKNDDENKVSLDG